jgi:ABC-2 type transport system ATP-binding protein
MIIVNKLTKLYRNGRGVRNLTFEIIEGEIFGYLGPNAAGKTTTIRNLLGFLRPDSGTCSINGLDCWKEAEVIQKNLGYIPGEIAFLDGYTGINFLKLIADMRKTKNRSRMKDLIDRFQLDPSFKIKKMSKGMKQKLAIITACMHDPLVMVFDEPTVSLDPLMRNIFSDFIVEEKSRGKTIFMSSHSFDEIERTCDRAGIIREGVLMDVQDIHVLKDKQRKTFVVTTGSKKDADKLINAGFEIGNIESLRIDVIVQGKVDQFIKTISELTIENLEVNFMSLEQVFMQYYGKEDKQ